MSIPDVLTAIAGTALAISMGHDLYRIRRANKLRAIDYRMRVAAKRHEPVSDEERILERARRDYGAEVQR